MLGELAIRPQLIAKIDARVTIPCTGPFSSMTRAAHVGDVTEAMRAVDEARTREDILAADHEASEHRQMAWELAEIRRVLERVGLHNLMVTDNGCSESTAVARLCKFLLDRGLDADVKEAP